jgi:hypothetical protein
MTTATAQAEEKEVACTDEHEWSDLDEIHSECLRCGVVNEHEPDYGDWMEPE